MTPVQRAVLWMLVALTCFSALAIASRELTVQMGTFEILFWRSLLGFGLIASLLARNGRTLLREQSFAVFRWHVLRNVSHFGGQCAWLIAIASIPLAELFALEFTTPLWAALLASIFLRERVNRFRLLALGLGLAGVLIILRPGTAVIQPASLIMLVGAIGFAISVITTRHITIIQSGQGSSVLLVLFYMTAIHTLLAFSATVSTFALPPASMWPWIIVATLSALCAHYALTQALSLADATIVLPIDYLRLPLIMVLAWWIYGEPVSWPILVGAALIIGGNAVGLYGEARRARRARRFAQSQLPES